MNVLHCKLEAIETESQHTMKRQQTTAGEGGEESEREGEEDGR
jgi:hypothetical protein